MYAKSLFSELMNLFTLANFEFNPGVVDPLAVVDSAVVLEDEVNPGVVSIIFGCADRVLPFREVNEVSEVDGPFTDTVRPVFHNAPPVNLVNRFLNESLLPLGRRLG